MVKKNVEYELLWLVKMSDCNNEVMIDLVEILDLLELFYWIEGYDIFYI